VSLVLEYLRAIREELREVRAEQREQRACLGCIERSLARIERDYFRFGAEISIRFDRIDDSLERIERRLEPGSAR
jgi:hypothetical protein